jgi:hypothetical protein
MGPETPCVRGKAPSDGHILNTGAGRVEPSLSRFATSPLPNNALGLARYRPFEGLSALAAPAVDEEPASVQG